MKLFNSMIFLGLAVMTNNPVYTAISLVFSVLFWIEFNKEGDQI